MAKKPSYTENLIRTPRKRSIYFWARRGISFIVALSIGGWLKLYIGDIGSLIAGTTIFFLVYIFGGVSKSMLKKSRLDFDKIEKCE